VTGSSGRIDRDPGSGLTLTCAAGVVGLALADGVALDAAEPAGCEVEFWQEVTPRAAAMATAHQAAPRRRLPDNLLVTLMREVPPDDGVRRPARHRPVEARRTSDERPGSATTTSMLGHGDDEPAQARARQWEASHRRQRQ